MCGCAKTIRERRLPIHPKNASRTRIGPLNQYPNCRAISEISRKFFTFYWTRIKIWWHFHSLQNQRNTITGYTYYFGLQNIRQCKFFMYVHMSPELVHMYLTTYSRKPGNYNGTIIFEIDIMKKSSPINSKFIYLQLSKPKCYFFSVAISCNLSNFQRKPNQTKQPKVFVKKSSLTKTLIDINHRNNAAIVIPWFSTLCG